VPQGNRPGSDHGFLFLFASAGGKARNEEEKS
jgi:hypothetical protein